ncbi:hypothetical protein HIM_06367 [Hirsutella minnesotensis 3608]|uniref:Uncharacterized protein n=1 Tax=Hirsutella minnesotensis 3608 TaxID=1043627 RepID=A0A0F7ZJ25_9HYPO|nr:hypothetical protein HIM_06367 [Hirsutella minnesotensis 3608]
MGVANMVLLPAAQKAQRVHHPNSKSPLLGSQPSPTTPELRQRAMPQPLFSSHANPRIAPPSAPFPAALPGPRLALGRARPRAASRPSVSEEEHLRPPVPPQAGQSPIYRIAAFPRREGLGLPLTDGEPTPEPNDDRGHLPSSRSCVSSPQLSPYPEQASYQLRHTLALPT